MAKYDHFLVDVKNQLAQSQKIVIATPAAINVDKLASALALYLSLKQAGKDVTIVTEGTLTVGHSNLYGVGDIKQTLPQTSGGDLTLTLNGVVDAQGKVASLEKLDWYPEGNNLNLVFHVLPGQKFEPTKIDTKYSGSSFDLIFVAGANNLSELGNIYAGNVEIFNKSFIVSIDNNANFGKVNVTDPNTSSISEMMIQVLQGLSLNIDQDIASNLVAGIYDSTSNLTVNIKPETFMALGYITGLGAKLPTASHSTAVPYPYDMAQFLPKEASQQVPVANVVIPEQAEVSSQASDNFITPQVVNTPLPVNAVPQVTSQNEERPQGEQAYSGNPENEAPAPDWLTPKIFKGGNLG